MSAETRLLRTMGLALLLLCVLLCFPSTVYADTFVVNTPDDTDDGSCSSHCSLREAINAANANAGTDTIRFSALDAASSHITITLNSLLPAVMDDETTIDGTTVRGYAGEPLINVVKGLETLEYAFALNSDGNIVRGFSLPGFGFFPQSPSPDPGTYLGGSIIIDGSGSLIENNVLGWGAWPSSVGVRINGSSNLITNNVISGNGIGIYLNGPGQMIFNNKIGTDAAGDVAIPNSYGIYDHISSGGGHVIGGPDSGQGNLISGNLINGIKLFSSGNTVQGNYIGTNEAGSCAIYNWTGISDEGENNLIGGSNPGEGNLISGNGRGFAGGGADTRLFGNTIGADSSGTIPIPNTHGIKPGPGLVVGGLNPGEGNLILGNANGMEIDYGGNILIYGNTFTKNSVGIDNEINFTNHVTISQNSFYNNISSSISFAGASFVYPEAPILDDISNSTLVGTTCSSCEVEIFLADPHPSGSGEGKTYLTTAMADQAGHFSSALALPQKGMTCQPITATATNWQENTSKFSKNLLFNCVVIEPPWLYPLWAFITGLFILLGIRLLRFVPVKPVYILLFSAIVGIAVGGGLFLFINQLPGAVVNFQSEEQVVYSSPLHDCSSYLYPAGFSPANGSSINPTERLFLSWAPIESLPADKIQWTISLGTFKEEPVELSTEGTRISMISFDFSPLEPDTYLWSISGQQFRPESETWLPFCIPGERYTFQILQAEEESDTNEEIQPETGAPPAEETASPEQPEDCEPTVTALMDLECRLGPGTSYQNVGLLLESESAAVDGQNSDGNWLWILNPDTQGHCWVWREGVEELCIPGQLSILPDPTVEP